MGKLLDLKNSKFGRLLIIKRYGSSNDGYATWLCLCDCGKLCIIRGKFLTSGHTQSCGCLFKEKRLSGNLRHGYSKTKIYRVWNDIIQRCKNPNNHAYKDYGGRGIKVCKRWHKFENFLEDMGQPPSSKYQIDRINNNTGYYKENCRWVLPKENLINKRNNININFNGKTQCLKNWAKEFNLNYQTLRYRINKLKWPIKKALQTPVGSKYGKK